MKKTTDTTKKDAIVKCLSSKPFIGAVIKKFEISVPETDENGEIKAIDMDLKLSFGREENGLNVRGLAEFVLNSCLDLEEQCIGKPVIFSSELIQYKDKNVPRIVGSKGYIESMLDRQSTEE